MFTYRCSETCVIISKTRLTEWLWESVQCMSSGVFSYPVSRPNLATAARSCFGRQTFVFKAFCRFETVQRRFIICGYNDIPVSVNTYITHGTFNSHRVDGSRDVSWLYYFKIELNVRLMKPELRPCRTYDVLYIVLVSSRNTNCTYKCRHLKCCYGLFKYKWSNNPNKWMWVGGLRVYLIFFKIYK